jgi:2-keto-4-pentenoate hydratase/2-oxohepta-3-ene-1,7-dioic acid hydratase in catechol pathway
VRFVRFAPPGGPARWAIAEAEALVEIEGDVFARYGATSRIWSLDEVELLAPVAPSKIVCLGTNFADHAAEMGKPLPAEPKIFLKAPSALLGPGRPIELPQVEGSIEHEAELGVVIGKRARHLTPDQALGCVFGYTCFNDVTARRLQAVDGVFARAKGFDTFAPCGPWIQTDLDWRELVIEGLVNGRQRQHAPAGSMIFSVPVALAFISRIMTLLPGDLVAMGTPEGVGPLQPGDEVEVRIAGIGSLVNPVITESLPKGAP